MIDNTLKSPTVHQLLKQQLAVPEGLPEGTVITKVAYVSTVTGEGRPLASFHHSVGHTALDVTSTAIPEEHLSHALLLLKIPTTATSLDDPERLLHSKLARDWVDANESAAASHMLTLQGLELYWAGERVAFLALSDRMAAVSDTVVEARYYEAELNSVETGLDDSWPGMEADLPLAYQFTDKMIGRQNQTMKRYEKVMKLKALLARIAPYMYFPHQYPPTLASQLGERLRDRMRMAHRHEHLIDQIEVLQDVYEMCSERSSSYLQARTGHILEWIIILLLLLQIVLWGFETLTTIGPST